VKIELDDNSGNAFECFCVCAVIICAFLVCQPRCNNVNAAEHTAVLSYSNANELAEKIDSALAIPDTNGWYGYVTDSTLTPSNYVSFPSLVSRGFVAWIGSNPMPMQPESILVGDSYGEVRSAVFVEPHWVKQSYNGILIYETKER
jgi:hypothetical protein